MGRNKIIYASIIAVIFLTAMFLFNDTMELSDIILAFIGAGSTIGYVWEWLNKRQEIKEKEEIKSEFEQVIGMSYNQFKSM